MRRPRWVAAFVAVVAVVSVCCTGPAWATAWTVHVTAGSAGLARSQSLPTPVPAAACQSSSTKVIVVSWSATTHVTYAVSQSTTTATGTYTQVASGLTGGSWTSGTLGNGNYWYKVSGSVGTKWATGSSSATGETTIQSSNPRCTQP